MSSASGLAPESSSIVASAPFAARTAPGHAETPAPALTSEVEASQAARLCAQHDSRRTWLDAIHVPRRWSLRRCVERGGDARAALVGFRRPTVVCPRLRDACHRSGIGHPPCVTTDADVVAA